MLTQNERKAALDLLNKNELAITETITGLGCPSRQALYQWHRKSQEAGTPDCPHGKWGHFTKQEKQCAVGRCLKNGHDLSKTVNGVGCPSVSGLVERTGGIAPGTREQRHRQAKRPPVQKLDAVLSLHGKNASGIAGGSGVSGASAGNRGEIAARQGGKAGHGRY